MLRAFEIATNSFEKTMKIRPKRTVRNKSVCLQLHRQKTGLTWRSWRDAKRELDRLPMLSKKILPLRQIGGISETEKARNFPNSRHDEAPIQLLRGKIDGFLCFFLHFCGVVAENKTLCGLINLLLRKYI